MTATRKPPNPWKPGESGNPAGRKPGTGAAEKLRKAIEKDLPDIVQSLVTAAKAGDAGAARLLLERAFPAIKPIEVAVPINLPHDGPLADQGRAVLAAAGAGDIAPGQAAQMLNALGTLAKVIETDELEARIAALEAGKA